jgi:6-phosphogluconolactonase (cycloisomerase 2 family)
VIRISSSRGSAAAGRRRGRERQPRRERHLLSRDRRFLYQLSSFDGRINAFRVGRDGGLTLVQTVDATGPSTMAGRIGIAAS